MSKNKYEIAEYLAMLMEIDAYYDDIGVTHAWLNAEMAAMTTALEGLIKQEKQYDETRSRPYIPLGAEARANPPQSKPGGSESTGDGNGKQGEFRKPLRR